MPTPRPELGLAGDQGVFVAAATATAAAHSAFLELSASLTKLATAQVHGQAELSALRPVASAPPRAFNRAQCLAFARGTIAEVLGPQFAAADPPAHAPAHGYRAKHDAPRAAPPAKGGIEVIFDSDLGIHVAVGLPDIHFYSGRYYRERDGRWEPRDDGSYVFVPGDPLASLR